MWIFWFLALILLTLAGFVIWRRLDHLADRGEMRRLVALQPRAPLPFDPAMVADLPEPARRFFTFAIASGTPLLTVAAFGMSGRFSLGTKSDPNYMPMQARQVLAAPHGFVWKMSGRSGHLSISGSDGARWTRFWLAGVVPVARFGGGVDHARAAFGRYVAEAVFWTPAALLPGPGIIWEKVDGTTARVTLRHGSMEQAVDVTVDPQGRPTQVVFLRWSNANPEKTYQLQPFGGYLSDFRQVQGFQVPMHVEAGNWFGTDDYFPFFIADIKDMAFPVPQAEV